MYVGQIFGGGGTENVIKISRFPGRDLTWFDGPGAVAEFGGLGTPPPPRERWTRHPVSAKALCQ